MLQTKITPETKVNVEYADNTSRETTIAELNELFSEETADWRKWFFGALETQGYANGKWAVYTIK